MKTTKSKLLIRLITLLTLTLGIVYASNIITPKETLRQVPYSLMSTAQLQAEVEKLSTKGELPFEMGLELIKRWQSEASQVH
ncbi:MAG: Unknown protein [uncultured Sulfurovum sp.]|uniref:Uncharacterized protein n=1 Tax=uncultured Sulfurovum sp. TaxID=269237 RepID=A0A6S6U4M0_9BACT|nr:MAG: Unknown protein [uncultured Sulfurovum sp.]